MARPLPLAFFLLVTSTVCAQPVLTYGEVATLPGDSFLYHASTVTPSSSPGADQVWDFSTLDTDSLIHIFYADPDTTPAGASFPLATVAGSNEQGGGAYGYSGFTPDSGAFYGQAIPGQPPIVYDNPMVVATYPAAYNDTWTDDFSASFSIGPLSVARTGTITGTADGWGSLIMPYGTVDSVLRTSFVEDFDDVSLFGTTTSHRVYTYYLRAGTHYPIIDQFSYTVSNSGGTTVLTGLNWLQLDISTGVPTACAPGEVDVYPVPAIDAITVRTAYAGSPGTADLFDAQGRCVLSSVVTGPVFTLGTQTLQPGTYALRVVLNGAVSTRRVVKQ